MTEERVIGKDNKLPWYLPEDLANFKRLTDGNTVVMGRKTYESIPKRFRPLSNRNNVVISKTLPLETGIDICPSLEEALTIAQSYGKEIFIAGGASIYQQVLLIADRMYISQIKKNYLGDSYFPEFEQPRWKVTAEQDFTEFKLIIYDKN